MADINIEVKTTTPDETVNFAKEKHWNESLLLPLQNVSGKVFLEYLAKFDAAALAKHYDSDSSTWQDLVKKVKAYTDLPVDSRFAFETELMEMCQSSSRGRAPDPKASSKRSPSASSSSSADTQPTGYAAKEKLKVESPWKSERVVSYMEAPTFVKDCILGKQDAMNLKNILQGLLPQLKEYGILKIALDAKKDSVSQEERTLLADKKAGIVSLQKAADALFRKRAFGDEAVSYLDVIQAADSLFTSKIAGKKPFATPSSSMSQSGQPRGGGRFGGGGGRRGRNKWRGGGGGRWGGRWNPQQQYAATGFYSQQQPAPLIAPATYPGQSPPHFGPPKGGRF